MQTDCFSSSQLRSSAFWAGILGHPAGRRDPVLIPDAAGARVLVTGAGGFIGAEMARIFAASGAEQIILLDICEQHLFEVSGEMTSRGYHSRCIPVLGSVCDGNLLDSVFREYRPGIVLHAAALKHVPLMEQNPIAAVETNAIGTWLVSLAAEAFGTQKMIFVSTDKAVTPHSIMGAAKRIAELVTLAPSRMRKTAVRLVNVIGSPGSVGPLFLEQIVHGRPVTVTHPEASRYFLTLAEAATLIAQAVSADAACGLLVPNPAEPMLIVELARRMIKASGQDVPIVFTETRPGEKLDESVISAEERYAESASPDLQRVESPAKADLRKEIQALEAAVANRDLSDVLRLVGELVPDYEPSTLLRDRMHRLVKAKS